MTADEPMSTPDSGGLREDMCLNWTTYWPHAVPGIDGLRTTDDRSKVTCSACLHALGSQKHPEPVPTPDSADDATVGEREAAVAESAKHELECLCPRDLCRRWLNEAVLATPPADDANRAPVSGGLDEGEREALVRKHEARLAAVEARSRRHSDDWAAAMVRAEAAEAERDTARREAGERIAQAIEALSVLDDDMRRRDAETMRSRAARIARADALTSDDGSGA